MRRAELAEQKFQPQLHILDDGFQHRSLARDFDIVLMTERDFDDRLLPSGRLREPLSSFATRRCDRAAGGRDDWIIRRCSKSRSGE